MKKLIFLLFFVCVHIASSAQRGNYDSREALGNGLYKVMSHERWGIVDDDDNLILSIEYNEPLFLNGRAVITNYGTRQLAGVVDSQGKFKPLPPYYVNPAYPFVCDGMLAVREEANGKWGFLNIDADQLLKIQIKGAKSKNKLFKKLGISDKGVKGVFVFDFVAPYVEGMAVVFTEKTGWHHIDRSGHERFRLQSADPALFRSSLHNGECVIFGDKGIVVCRETPDFQAGIINYLEDSYEIKDYRSGLTYPYVIRTNGSTLFLNSRLQADKFESSARGDSVIFIERPKIVPVVVEKKDSFNLSRDITVELSKTNVSAGSKGTAAVTLNITNDGQFDSDTIHVLFNIKGTKKEWTGTISKGETHQITLYIPAKFSASSISRECEWSIDNSSDEISGSETVTIRRYRPSRR